MKVLPRVLLFTLVLAASVALDQLTKVVATNSLKGSPPHIFLGDLFRLQYATNEGAFLSLGASLPDGARYWVLTVAVGLLLLGITIFTLTSKKLDAWHVAGYALIASGGFSNWFDRARFDGKVVDFMNMGLGTQLRTGIFNVADLAILAGIGVLLLAGRAQEKRDKAAAQAAQAAQAQAPKPSA